MKKITLQVNGRERSFSEQELIAIVEKHLSDDTTQQATTFKKAVQKPTEEQWFEVKPQAIDQKLFEEKRDDEIQENTRQLILEAFEEMKKNPQKYGRNFKTMMPKKTWWSKTVDQLYEMSRVIGNHNADWVEQTLEWGQRISNGESWEAICNTADTARWYRLVVWKNGYVRIVGGSVHNTKFATASNVSGSDDIVYVNLSDVVPLIVAY